MERNRYSFFASDWLTIVPRPDAFRYQVAYKLPRRDLREERQRAGRSPFPSVVLNFDMA